MRKLHFILVLTIAFFSLQSIAQTELLDFEMNSLRIDIDTLNPKNSWKIAEPKKNNFDSAYSGTNAIMTDTVKSYISNNKSQFTLGIEIEGGGTVIQFQHKFDAEEGKDGGYIELSDNLDSNWVVINGKATEYPYSLMGLTWFDVSLKNFPYETDTLKNGIHVFTGKQENWVSSEINFYCVSVKKSFPFYLRFTFESDSIQTNQEGWIIDDIRLKFKEPCPGFTQEYNQQKHLKVYPNPVSSISRIEINQTEQANFIMYNSLGAKVFERDVSNQTTMDISAAEFIPGIHFYTLIGTNNSILNQGKLIIHK